MKKLLLILIAVIILFLGAKPSLAASSFELDQNNFLLQISGNKEVKETIIVKNLTGETLQTKLTWEKTNVSTEHTIDFAQIQNPQLEIQPYAIDTTTIIFTAPAGLKTGDYYGQLKVSSGNENKTANFTLRFLGERKESVTINNISIESGKLSIGFENNGNITSKVSGKVDVSDFFGSSVMSSDVNQFDLKASEKISKVFGINTNIPGPYQVKVSYSFGDKETQETTLETIWVLNFWLILVPIFLVLIGFGLFKFFTQNKNVQTPM